MKTYRILLSQKKFFFPFILLLLSILPANTLLNESSTAGKDGKNNVNVNIKDNVSHTLNSFLGSFIENFNQKPVSTKFFLQSNRLSIGFSQSSMRIATVGQYSKVAILRFVGSNKVEPIGVKKLSSTSNYFIGSNTSDWMSAHYYKQIVYKNIYNHIDLYYYLKDGKLKYEFYAYPGANINDIQLQWSNSVDVKQNSNGMLINGKTDSFGNQFSFLDTNPINYNSISRNQEIQGRFKIINAHTYGFNIPTYDKNSLLIIDPSIVDFGTYVSGSNNDYINSMVLDSSDNIYVTGYTTSLDFPTSSNAINTTTTDTLWSDAFLFKLSANGSTLLYSTYIVGSGVDLGNSIVLDTAGNIYITGYTTSNDFPVTSNALNKTNNGGEDIFIMKFAPNGSTLLYSTYLGGSGNDESVSIGLDSQNNMYLTGTTASSINFPTKNAFNNTYGGGSEDGFVVKLNANGQALNYSTYLGGSSYDTPRSIKVDSSGYAYITGNTWSSDFPTITGSFYGASDIFITKMSLNGSQLIYSTLLSSSADSYGITVDGSGNAYISGNSYFISYQNLMVYELAANGSTVLHSKSIDAGGNSYGTAISLDNYGNIYIGGYTQGDTLPTTNDAINSTGDTGYSDGVVVKLFSNFSVAYSTYFGGTGNDEITSIAPNSQGHIMVAGYTVATDFPVTAGSYNTTGDNASTNDGFISSINLQPETVPPDVVGPSNLTYESGTTGHMLNWTVGDVHPGTYTLTRDGAVVGLAYTPWTNGTIPIPVDGLQVGSHIYNMTVYDGVGNSVSDVVNVTVVDTTSPTINAPSDITHESGTTGHMINWTVGDVNPDVYNITRNGTLYTANTHWINGTISLNIDGLSIGSYEFNISIYDAVGNSAFDTVLVTVVDTTSPTISGPFSISYEFGTTGHNISWTLGDVNPGIYNVTRNGILVGLASNPWTNETISLNIDNLSIGTYKFNITVYDGVGNVKVDSLLVTVVDTIAPSVSNPSDITFEFGTIGHTLSWTVGDINPGFYNVTKNGSLYLPTAQWKNGTLSVNLDHLAIGVYNFTLILYDKSGNIATNSVFVVVTGASTTSSTGISPLTHTSSTISTESKGTSGSSGSNNTSFGGFLPVILSLVSLGVLTPLISTRKKKK